MRFSKSDVRYWLERIFLEENHEYSIRICFKDRRERFPLGPNKYEAARKAKKIYQNLRDSGWEKTLQSLNHSKAKALPQSDATVGEFLRELRALHASKVRTIDNYASPFRRIVSDISGLRNGGRGGNQAKHRIWRDKVEAVKLSTLTPGKIQKWKESFLVSAGGDDPVRQRSARVTVNSALREARSLFAPGMIEGLENIALPDPLPFARVKLEKRSMPRYQSTFDIMALIKEAQKELAISQPELFKVFLLAAMGGLRRNEIDKLEWASFNWFENSISIVPTRFFRTKSEASIRKVWAPPEMMELFRAFRAKTGGLFVIESAVKPLTAKTYDHYRCGGLFKKLLIWLNEKGVSGRKKLHSLRKEYGSLVAAKYGIFAAKEALGHQDIATTAAFYLDAKDKPMVGLGEQLAVPRNVIPINPAHDAFRPEGLSDEGGKTPVSSK